MKELVEVFLRAGCEDVRTYIQSGNVIFRASPGVATRLPSQITLQIATSFGYRTPVILRTTEQLRDVIANNPFLEAGVAEETLHVMFLAELRRVHSASITSIPIDHHRTTVHRARP